MNDAVLVGHRDNLPRLKDVVQRMSDGKHGLRTEPRRDAPAMGQLPRTSTAASASAPSG